MPKARSYPTRMHGASGAATYRGNTMQALAGGAKQAKACRCEKPVTYQDEDGERRCLCGRAYKP